MIFIKIIAPILLYFTIELRLNAYSATASVVL